MKLGISIDVGTMEEFQRRIRIAAEAGYSGCQIFYRGDDLNRENVERMVELCDRHQLEIGPLGGYISAVKPDEAPMEYTLPKLLKLIDLMPVFDSRDVLVWSGTLSDEHMFQYDDRNYTEAARGILDETVHTLLDALKPIDGRLVIEPFFNHILGDWQSLKEFIRDVDPERITVAIDPPNFYATDNYGRKDELLNEMIHELGPYISVAHCKDVIRTKESDWPFEYPGPGAGELNYPLFLQSLSETGFDGWLIVEHVEPEEFASAREYMAEQCHESGIELDVSPAGVK